jgi:asparagine synthase (glutamine-hydrolysing)
VEEFRRLLSRSLELHLRSDVPIGSCLSGGLDSGTIVCLGSRLLGEGNRFRTFTTRYPSLPEIDESHYAEAVISAAGARPVFFEPTLEFFRDRFQDVVACQGEPFSSTSIFAQYALYDRIGKTDVKVILDGQGADEILGGYHGYLPVFLHSLLKQGKLAQGLYEWCHLRAAYGSPLIPTFRQMARSIGARLGKGLRGAPQRAFGSAATRGPKPDGAQADECETRLRQLGHFHECGTFEETLIHLTCESNLPQLLRYEDRSSMAHSIEARVPFLEPELVSFVLSLPASLKISRGMTKSLLRDALEGILPEAVRLRRSKLGFPTPEKQWLRDAFRLDVEQAGSRAWRELAVNHWRNWLGKGSRCHAA